MQQKTCHRLIYKLHSKQLKRAKWNLNIDLGKMIQEQPRSVVALSDSQILRFIDRINGADDISAKAHEINRRIRLEKKKPRSRETKANITNFYRALYDLQFQKDYVCIIMDSNADYDRANKGFTINGIRYRRFLGTNGGIKNSTIVYVNEELYPELKRRLDNGRDMSAALVPAKLEAYQALVCSGSTPLPPPKGIIVVNDCITHFTDDVILINDETDGEPIMTFEKDYTIEHNDSDGYGLMLPSYARRVNEYLTGDGENTVSGMNTRYAWTKGMVYTFDFIEFAQEVAGTYEITDIWGCKRDVREAEVILTASMLKLWNCYKSWEDYYENCEKNGYEFSTTKTTPMELEHVRDTNYQFLQSYTFTDEELKALCQPTIDEIKDVIGLDYRKTLAFVAGFGLNDKNAFDDSVPNYARALMIDKRMINDPFVRRKAWNMISNRIDAAKRGAIRVNANYAMISGDPYALAQSMFALPVTGLLKAREIYHKYWIDKGSDELVCFRAPMTCHNNIRKMKLCKSEEAAHWYQYIKTALIYNCWDTACDAMNGADKDGDTNMCTDNPILLRRTLNSPTIMCVQRKAEKKVATEEDIIQANKLAFNDDIGVVTNHVTSMIEVQAGFDTESDEYETLSYRIMCGQLYQQNTIDRAKGIIAKPMPAYWYSYRGLGIQDGDDEDTVSQKEYNKRIAALHKPYFMSYVYPVLRSEYKQYVRTADKNACRNFRVHGIKNVSDLSDYENKTDRMKDFLSYYHRLMPTGNNGCVVNRICWLFEKEFKSFSSSLPDLPAFDYRIMKSDAVYSRHMFNCIKRIYEAHKIRCAKLIQKVQSEKADVGDIINQRIQIMETFEKDCYCECSNGDELCNIVLDMCYETENSKQFSWDVCWKVILKNLLAKNNGVIEYPMLVDQDGDFEFCGKQFTMMKKNVYEENNDDYTE